MLSTVYEMTSNDGMTVWTRRNVDFDRRVRGRETGEVVLEEETRKKYISSAGMRDGGLEVKGLLHAL